MTAPSIQFDIYIAGDYNHAKQILQTYVQAGECVSVSKCDYIYKYGCESGVKVTLINYPRFPRSEDDLFSVAKDIGYLLMSQLAQGSYTITGPDTSYFYDRRDYK